MSEQKPIATHLGYFIFRLQEGGFVFRKGDGMTHGAKTLAGAFGAIRKLEGLTPKGSGQVLPDTPTYRLGRDWARKAREGRND